MSGLHKLAGDLQGVLLTSSQHLQKMAHANAALLAENAAQSRELMAYKLARRMEQRGLGSELDFEAKVASLVAMPNEKLATMEQAIELAPGGFRLGSVQADDTRGSSEPGSNGSDPLDSWISSNAAYT